MGQIESSLPPETYNKLPDTENDDSTIQLTINGVLYKVSKSTPAETSLSTFIRETAGLKGTKVMCQEGGCGVCIVTAELNGYIMAVNSCLVSILLCDGWKITTVEGLGNKKIGYHTLQATLADMNGSQCGFCSPGWVMNMYSLMQNRNITMKEIENSFGGNICRCTGYRPILDAFKGYAIDASASMKNQIKDIEEAHKIKSCKNCPKKLCNNTCQDIEIIYKSCIPRSLKLELQDSVQFYKVLNIDSIFEIFSKNPEATYRINGGNTAHGVYRVKKVQIYIDVNDIPDLRRIEKTDDALTLGANVTLSIAKKNFEKYMDKPGFEYLKEMAKHIDLIASVPVRNIGTIAGNLMIKNQHPEFPSDVFLILETAGAKIHILDSPGSKINIMMLDFMNTKMQNRLIYSIVLPSMGKEYVYKTYKIMPRAQNAHAIINAGFLFKLNKNGKVLEKPNIIFGGIKPDFLHASRTEEFFKEKIIYNTQTVKEALKILKTELTPDHVLPDFKPEFRKLLAVGLLYKFILSLDPSKVRPKFRSGSTLLERELSSGKQDYDTDKNLWPVNKPIPKVESIYQTSGEGEFVNDLTIKHNEVFCALTLAETLGIIEKIEYEEALSIDGVIAFYSAKDIPGKNAFINSDLQFVSLDQEDEVLFADEKITYAGQAYGMIVAKSQSIAVQAASKVKLIYKKGSKQKPLITIRDVLKSNDKSRIKKTIDWPARHPPGKDEKYKIKGSHEIGSQYHFTMETQTCVCIPIEDGMDVFSATQYMDLTQSSIATLLKVPTNSINLQVRRLGGGYGAKISRATQIACACALACHLLNRPARLVMSLEDNMRTIGKRVPTYLEWEVSVDEEGKIQKLDLNYWGNLGASLNESHASGAISHFMNCYEPMTWSMTGYDVRTDIPSNTWCRSPGSTEGIGAIENLMERIAREIGKDPVDVRISNMNQTDKEVLVPMINELKSTSDYNKRLKDVEKFNNENRWKKRGISLVTMKYPLVFFGQFHSNISIYARDGTVSVTHGGIEMGQGLHTKIAQIVAYLFNIDLKMVIVKPSSSLTAPNSFVTGGSVGSDVCGIATQKACEILLKRLAPIKEKMEGNPSWQEIIFKAHTENVNLSASYMFAAQPNQVYPIYGATVSEVEVDMLTGQHLIRRVDILEDVGISLSPKIDLGQIEGAFVMGIGYWTFEELIYDPDTGGLTNNRTWNYKVPGAKDIPVDFRISFRRNSPNPTGILRSKTAGEPPLCMSCSIPIAIRNALNSARADAGNNERWYQLDNSLTAEKILLNSLTDINEMEL